MNNKHFFFFHLLILLFLLGLNVYIYSNRNDGYAYSEQMSYAQLYAPFRKPRILGMQYTKSDSLLLKMDKVPAGTRWRITFDSSESSYESTGPNIKLKPGKHVYTLQSTSRHPQTPVYLGLNYTPSEVYKANQRERNSVTELYYSSVPVGNYSTYALQEWQHTSPFITATEEEQARLLLNTQTQVNQEDPTLVKLKGTGLFILGQLDHARGIPGDTMDSVSPFQRYLFALAGRSKVWCGDLSSIFSFFLSAQHVYSREVCLEGKTGDVHLAGHSFNEVYIPELDQWLFSDLTSGALLLRYEGKYLNAIDLYQLHRNEVQGIEVLLFRDRHVAMMPYDSIKPFYDYYFKNEARFTYYLNKQYKKDLYSFTSKLVRYFSKDASFVNYAGTFVNDNRKFYFKQAAALALSGFILYLVILALIKLIFKQNRKL